MIRGSAHSNKAKVILYFVRGRREPRTAAAIAQEEAETRGKGGWQRPYCNCNCGRRCDSHCGSGGEVADEEDVQQCDIHV
jgi:hypothetical protein